MGNSKSGRLYTFYPIRYNEIVAVVNISHDMKAGEYMPSDKEMINNLIDNYTSLQRIKKSDNIEKELDYQIKILKAKLESFGIVTTDLDL